MAVEWDVFSPEFRSWMHDLLTILAGPPRNGIAIVSVDCRKVICGVGPHHYQDQPCRECTQRDGCSIEHHLHETGSADDLPGPKVRSDSDCGVPLFTLVATGNTSPDDSATLPRLEEVGRVVSRTWSQWRLLEEDVIRQADCMCTADCIGKMATTRTSVDEIEQQLTSALPQLHGRGQRHLLRYLFEHCQAMEDSQQKGAAFERLMLGLFSLVPGWIPGERGLRTPENELDLTILVEPAIPSAKYWFEIFGPKIIVECKNYPDTLNPKAGAANQVTKLQRVMKKAGVKLGLLVNTGRISASLRAKAIERSTPESLVVPLEGSHLSLLIDNPQDIEYSLKQWVSNAAIKADSPPTNAPKPKRTRRGQKDATP